MPMTEQLPRWYILTLTILILVGVTYFFTSVLAYLVIAVSLSFIGRPIMGVLTDLSIKGKQMPRWLAAVLTITTMLSVASISGAIFIPLIASQAQTFTDIDTDKLAEDLQAPIQDIEDFIFTNGLVESNGRTLSEIVLEQVKELASMPLVTNLLNNVLSITANLMVGFFSVLFILFFFLKDRDLFFNIIKTLIPDEKESKLVESFDEIKVLLTRYFLAVLLQLTVVFTILSVGLRLVGLENFFLIAFIAAIFNIIPYIGPMIGAFIGLILGVTINLELGLNQDLLFLILQIMGVFAIAQLVDNFISQPLIFSNSVKAHPLEIFILIIAAGTAGGVIAMILAIPAYTVLRVIGKEFFSDSKIVQKLTKDL